MGDEERQAVVEIVASGLTVSRWCAETGRMGTTKAYRILGWFRENDPSAFGAGGPAGRGRHVRAGGRFGATGAGPAGTRLARDHRRGHGGQGHAARRLPRRRRVGGRLGQ